MSPSRVQVVAAIETLSAAGFSFSGPAAERISLLSSSRVAELLDVSMARARDIMRDLPGSVMLPGGDLRCRVQELERWLDRHPAEVAAKAQASGFPR